jgi:hypothetical protein
MCKYLPLLCLPVFKVKFLPERTHALTHYPLMYNTYFVSLIFLLLSLFASVQSYLSDFSLVSMEGTHVQIFTTTLSASVQS